MDAIRATWKNGQIVLDGPVDWPEGYRLLVEPDLAPSAQIGMREEEWSNSPEAIADWLAWYDSLEPLIFAPEEEAEWEGARRAQKEFEKAHFEEWAEKLRRMWE
jgi:hypothetical protein